MIKNLLFGERELLLILFFLSTHFISDRLEIFFSCVACVHIFSSGSMVRAVILMSCMLLLYFQLLSKFYNLKCTRRQSIPTSDGSNYRAQ